MPQEIIYKTPEHDDDRAARLAQERHKRWRETIGFVCIDILARLAVIASILLSVAWAASVLADKNSTAEARNVADSSVKIILGSITGFAVGKGASKIK